MLGQCTEAVYVGAGFSPSPLSFDFAFVGFSFIRTTQNKRPSIFRGPCLFRLVRRSAGLFSILYFLTSSTS
jgi:hypothetical protein